MTEIAYSVNDGRAPITSRLNRAREQLTLEINELNEQAPKTVPGMLTAHAATMAAMFDLFADIIVAVHQLETGELPDVEVD